MRNARHGNAPGVDRCGQRINSGRNVDKSTNTFGWQITAAVVVVGGPWERATRAKMRKREAKQTSFARNWGTNATRRPKLHWVTEMTVLGRREPRKERKQKRRSAFFAEGRVSM